MKMIIKKGLDIPAAGGPLIGNPPQNLPKPLQIALNLDPFDNIRFKLLVKPGEKVKIGQPLVESKVVPGQMFVSPASGSIHQIKRGLKRRLVDIVIDLDSEEFYEEHGQINVQSAERREILELFMRSGIFAHIRLRPFNLTPDPKYIPRDVFVTAWESRPFVPPYEMQVEGNEISFQAGLDTLAKLTDGKVHLVYGEKSECRAFIDAKNVEKHTVLGPHPSGNNSVHIHRISPIRFVNDYVWSLSATDVLVIGKMVLEGRYFTQRILSIAGNGVLESSRGYYKGRLGYPIKELISGRIANQLLRFISGDFLTGKKVEADDFLGLNHTCFTVIPENTKRQPFHFLRLGLNKFSATRTYLAGLLTPPKEGFSFTTNQHGEPRAFIDGSVYDRVMPMRIPTMFLIKALIAEDYELAERLGLLEVVPEDFDLTTFICPSKIGMIDIVKEGLHRYSQEVH